MSKNKDQNKKDLTDAERSKEERKQRFIEGRNRYFKERAEKKQQERERHKNEDPYWQIKKGAKLEKKKIVSYQEAIKIVGKYKVNNIHVYRQKFKSGELPRDLLPSVPSRAYKEFNYEEFFSLGKQALYSENPKKKFISERSKLKIKILPYEQAKAYIRTHLPLSARKTFKAYVDYVIEHSIYCLPLEPKVHYYITEKINVKLKDFLSPSEYITLDELRRFVKKRGISSYTEWVDYWKTYKRPNYIPLDPSKTYKSEWGGWPDLFGHVTPPVNASDVIDALLIYHETDKEITIPSNVLTFKRQQYELGILVRMLSSGNTIDKFYGCFKFENNKQKQQVKQIIKTMCTPWYESSIQFIVPNVAALLWEISNVCEEVDLLEYKKQLFASEQFSDTEDDIDSLFE